MTVCVLSRAQIVKSMYGRLCVEHFKPVTVNLRCKVPVRLTAAALVAGECSSGVKKTAQQATVPNSACSRRY